MNTLQRFVFESRRGMFMEFEGLTTHFKPRDVALYRKLLPSQFGVPSQPIVTIFVADHIRVHPRPLARYQEWSVLLKAERGDDMGWFSLTMPVTRWLPMVGGRYLGFPKYVTDEISLSTGPDGRVARARYRKALQLTLEFRPGVTRRLESWEQELAENKLFFKGNNLQLVPPGRGPRVSKIMFHHMIPPKSSPEPGMVRVRVNPGETWEGLVPDEAEFPGTYDHFLGGFNLVSEPLPLAHV